MHLPVSWNAPRALELINQQIERARAFFGDDGSTATALLPILHSLQHAFGCISPEAIALVAHELNLSKADVKGVVSFYRDFRQTPAGPHSIALCRAEACQARGSEPLAEHLERAHGLTPGETRQGVTLATTYCLGNCALGPTALVDDERLVGKLDSAQVDHLIAGLKGAS